MEWILWIYNSALEQGKVPEDWIKAVVLLCTGKESEGGCKSYRRKSVQCVQEVCGERF